MHQDQARAPAVRSRLQLIASYEAGIWRSFYRWLTRRPRADDPDAALFDAHIPWEEISAIRPRRSSAHRKLQIEHDQTGASVAHQGTNNVEVVFRQPVPVPSLDGRQASVDAIHFYADSPTALLTAARVHLTRIREAPSV